MYVGGAGGDGKGVTPGTGGYNGGGKGGSGGTTQHISTTGYPTKQTFFGATAGGDADPAESDAEPAEETEAEESEEY